MNNKILFPLKKLSKYLLFEVFEFLSTEDLFLTILLLDRYFYQKIQEFSQILKSIQITDMNSSWTLKFPKIKFVTIQIIQKSTYSTIVLPNDLKGIKIYDISNDFIIPESLNNLESFKFNSITTATYNKISSLVASPYFSLIKRIKLIPVGLANNWLVNFRAFDKIEEVYIVNSNLIEKRMDELFECKNLKKLKIYEFSSFFVPLFNMQRIEKKINLLQNLKNLHTLGFNSDIIKNNSFANTVNSLKVLESIALYGNVETEILENFLNLTYKKPITNFEVKIRLNDLVWHQAYYCIEKILLSYQNLEHLKVAVEGLDSEKNSKIAFETIKNILLHPSLYKFNGIPIKKIEADESFTITLYENLVYFNNTLPEIFGSDLTSQLLLYYQDKISKMTELQIKSKFSATKCVNLEKLVKKIQTLGFFADSHYYFKLPKFALIAVLLMIKDQPVFKSLKLESFYNGIHFLEILQSSLYLESFSGFYNDLSKALFSKITSLSLDFKKRKINVSDLVFILTSSNLQTVIIKNAMIVKDSQVSEI